MNEVVLIGRISNDLELKDVNGIKIINFNLAVNRQDKDKNTDFIPVAAFNQIAENMVKYQKKGNLLAVKGSIRQNEYTDKEGNKRYSFNVVANKVQYLESSNKDYTNYKNEVASKAIDDEDVPF